MTSPTSMTQSAALKVPTREQCEKATYHLVRALNNSAANRLDAFADNIFKAATALGLLLSADEPAAQQPQSDLVRRLQEAVALIPKYEKLLGTHNVLNAWTAPDTAREEWTENIKTTLAALRLIDPLLARIEALEAAAAQPSREAVNELVKAARTVIVDRNETALEFCGLPTQIRNSTILALQQALRAYDTPASPDAQPEREAALVKAARDAGEVLFGRPATPSVWNIYLALETALAAYDTPAKDERREEAK